MEQGANREAEKGNFFNNALQRLSGWRQYLPFAGRQPIPRFDPDDARDLMQSCLDGVGGEVAARSRAAELGFLYLNLSREERIRFLELLNTQFDIDAVALDEAVNEHLVEPTVESYLELRRSSQPTRIDILKRLNSLPDGFRFLVELRADLLSFLSEAPSLATLDHDLQSLFESWFDVGLLTFTRITWDSSASLLERIVEYEAVHRIRSWQDLKNRLDSDRRCYAFFHPKIPGDPLIFVEVALTEGTPGSIHTLLEEETPAIDSASADTAVFYSITNTQKGLRGISFGSFLLKRVMEDLSVDLPHLKRFVTLSPIPGFRKWLLRLYEEEGDRFLRQDERERLQELLESRDGDVGLGDLLESPEWAGDREIAQCLQEPLLDLCARYLLLERRDGKPLDPVARFHITNGASVDRLNYLGDTSESGLRQSFGIMVSYLYSPDKVERNHESFFHRSEVAAAPAIRKRATQRGGGK